MGPETQRRSENLILGLPAKKKMSMFEKSESKGVRDTINCESSTKILTKVNDIADMKKENLNVPVSDGENMDINVMDAMNSGGVFNGDETEDSSGSLSSFGDTVSDGNDGVGMSDEEIISEFHGVHAAWDYPGFDEAFRTRKKKVTSHWRNFIRPIMWRCKWAELQMRKLQIQASMYSKILEEFDEARKVQKENISAESQCSRTELLPHQMKHRKTMIRRKRKRVEDTTDAAAYMRQHNLFGYSENKGASTDFAQLASGYSNSVININLLDKDDTLVHFNDEETSLERILAKIDSIQLRARSLMNRVDNVISENHGRFSSLDKMTLLTTPSDSGESTAPDSTATPTDNVNVFTTSPSTTTTPSNDDEDATRLNEQPMAENKLLVYRRTTKRKTQSSEKQLNTSSSAPGTQNERSNVFLASRITALQNNQKKRGKRKRCNSVKKT